VARRTVPESVGPLIALASDTNEARFNSVALVAILKRMFAIQGRIVQLFARG